MGGFFMEKRVQKYLLLLITLLFALSLAACSFASGSEKPADIAENQPQDTADGQPDGQVSNQQKDIMILFTSDVHCRLNEGFGFTGLDQIRTNLSRQGYEVKKEKTVKILLIC